MLKDALVPLVFVVGAGTAQAATLTATPVNPAIVEGFTIEFTDANSDGLLQFGEIDSFTAFLSGLDLIEPDENTSVNTVPDIAGISTFSFLGDFGQPSDSWRFFNSNPGVSTLSRDFWTYELTVDDRLTPIPLPAGLPMLLAGLGLMGLVARRRAASRDELLQHA